MSDDHLPGFRTAEDARAAIGQFLASGGTHSRVIVHGEPCTPSTEHVRAVYAGQHGAILAEEHGREFDRWLEQHDKAPAPTARQLIALDRYINEARLRHGVDVHPWGHYGWQTTYQDESRPGRGHDLNATWTDGERIVAIHLDVYGYGSMGVGDVDWTHSDANEECECEACIEDARAEHDRAVT